VSPSWTTPAGLHLHQPELPIESRLASFDAATGWLNSEPLTPAGQHQKVVLVNFWTYTCVNWLRQLPYVRAWYDRYAQHGLVVVGVHTPEFGFERDEENIRRALSADDIRYPVAVDSRYGVWGAFDNHYWPALYFADAHGRIRHHHYGEGEYEQSEMVIQQLLEEAGGTPGHDRVSVQPHGLEMAADYTTLRSPETYTGYDRTGSFASPEGVRPGKPQVYTIPKQLWLNRWALAGDWTIEGQPTTLNSAGGQVAFRFHARDVNLVMGPAVPGGSIPFRVLLDGQPPAAAHGDDIAGDGRGTLTEQRLHQLIRQDGVIHERTVSIIFDDPEAQIFCFTFG
jgi:thiol-disulfide isomerase/thioredoxin